MSPPFTPRADVILGRAFVAVFLTGLSVVAGTYYYAMPSFTRVGYAPTQPVAFSHAMHAGQLGMNCQYCHSQVPNSPHANIPTSQVCKSCHTQIKPNSPLIQPLKQSWESGEPIAWERVHKVPDYVFFNHSVHVKRGVSCVSCHGKINEMPVVKHDQPLSMGWCLACHRQPENHVRFADAVYDLNWTAETATGKPQAELGKELVEKTKINPPQHCGGCHR